MGHNEYLIRDSDHSRNNSTASCFPKYCMYVYIYTYIYFLLNKYIRYFNIKSCGTQPSETNCLVDMFVQGNCCLGKKKRRGEETVGAH